MNNRTLLDRIFDLFIENKNGKAPVEIIDEQPIQEASDGLVLKPNVWGISGRSSMMQTRNMMQLRVFQK